MAHTGNRWVKLGRFGLYAVNPLTWGKAAEVAADWLVDVTKLPAQARKQLLGEPERALTPDDPPSLFLREEHQVVQFSAREKELEVLENWARDIGGKVSLALLTGGPGCGKSRLARRLCELALGGGWNDPWLAGTIDLSELPDPETIGIAAATSIFEPLMEWRGPVLIVVDYVERQATYLEAILKAANHADRGQHQFRILLTSRSEGEWWELLRAKFDRDLPEDNPFEGALRVALASLTQGDEAHAEEFQRSFAAFQNMLSGDEEAARPAPPQAPQFKGQIEALDVHMAALLAAYGDTLPAQV